MTDRQAQEQEFLDQEVNHEHTVVNKDVNSEDFTKSDVNCKGNDEIQVMLSSSDGAFDVQLQWKDGEDGNNLKQMTFSSGAGTDLPDSNTVEKTVNCAGKFVDYTVTDTSGASNTVQGVITKT